MQPLIIRLSTKWVTAKQGPVTLLSVIRKSGDLIGIETIRIC